jgi:hypothetical protein
LEKEFDHKEGIDYTFIQLSKKLMLIFGNFNTVRGRAREYMINQYPYLVHQLMDSYENARDVLGQFHEDVHILNDPSLNVREEEETNNQAQQK